MSDVVVAKKIIILAISIIPAALLLFSNQSTGPGLSPDSISYISAAKSFSEGLKFIDYDGKPLVNWPPLYSIVLSIFLDKNTTVVNYVTFIHAIFLVMTTYLAAAYVQRYTKAFFLSLLTALLVALSSPLILVSQWVWSEIIFSFLCLLSLYYLTRYLDTSSRKFFISLVFCSSLAFLQRYSGFSLILSVSILLIIRPRVPVFERLIETLSFGIITTTPLFFWLFTNYSQTSLLSGERDFSVERGLEAFISVPYSVGGWFLPHRIGAPIVVSAVALFLILCVFALYVSSKKSGETLTPIKVLFVFVVIYSLFTIYTLSTACCVDRFMAPIYPEIVCLSIFTLYTILKYFDYISINKKHLSASTILLCCICFLVLPPLSLNILKIVDLVERNRSHGLQYDGEKWANSAIISLLKRNNYKDDFIIYSNQPHPIYYYLGVSPVFELPSKTYYYTGGKRNELQDFVRQVASEGRSVLVVWFKDNPPWLYDLKEIREVLPLELLDQGQDGSIYVMRHLN